MGLGHALRGMSDPQCNEKRPGHEVGGALGEKEAFEVPRQT